MTGEQIPLNFNGPKKGEFSKEELDAMLVLVDRLEDEEEEAREKEKQGKASLLEVLAKNKKLEEKKRSSILEGAKKIQDWERRHKEQKS